MKRLLVLAGSILLSTSVLACGDEGYSISCVDSKSKIKITADVGMDLDSVVVEDGELKKEFYDECWANYVDSETADKCLQNPKRTFSEIKLDYSADYSSISNVKIQANEKGNSIVNILSEGKINKEVRNISAECEMYNEESETVKTVKADGTETIYNFKAKLKYKGKSRDVDCSWSEFYDPCHTH